MTMFAVSFKAWCWKLCGNSKTTETTEHDENILCNGGNY